MAGFLDGDGSIICQLVRFKHYRYGFRVRVSICLYQNKNGKVVLEWLKNKIGAGYIRSRAGNMADYTLVARKDVRRVLEMVKPYVMLKKKHVELAEEILGRAESKPSPGEFLKLAKLVDKFATLNYSKKKLNNAKSVEDYLNSKGVLAPVTTDPILVR